MFVPSSLCACEKMKIIHVSPPTELNENPCPEKDRAINVIYQFFVHRDADRHHEIKECLRRNIQNSHITSVHLLNERIYTDEEMGITELPESARSKIIQTNVVTRLTFEQAYQYITNTGLCGYNAIINGDIFFDKSINQLRFTNMHCKKQVMALLRFEYNANKRLEQAEIFGPRFDSQDVWIIHSNFTIPPEQQRMFSFYFGKPGCDNKAIYLYSLLGYEVLNDPDLIKTYHYHTTQIRDYTKKDTIGQPWGMVVPTNYPVEIMPSTLGIHVPSMCQATTNLATFHFYNDAIRLHNYIQKRFDEQRRFIIPRVGGDSLFYVIGDTLVRRAKYGKAIDTGKSVEEITDISEYENYIVPNAQEKADISVLCSNEGKAETHLNFTDFKSIAEFAVKTDEAYDNCDIFFGYDIWDNEYKLKYNTGQDYISRKHNSKMMLWNAAFEAYHYAHWTKQSEALWTRALSGKNVLIITDRNINRIYEVATSPELRKEVYGGIDLFEGCASVDVLTGPVFLHSGILDFKYSLNQFMTFLISKIQTGYINMKAVDIVLVSCGGFGNVLCNELYKLGKSSINVGACLDLMFGIINTQTLRDRSDVVKLYRSKAWTKSE